jgi:cytoskeletal protein CcmA (bactofilin family)
LSSSGDSSGDERTPLKKKEQTPSEGINALLGGGTEFEGKLSFEGAVRIDGVFTGEIGGAGMIIVGEKGRVRANIAAGLVMIRGEVQGNIRAKDRIEAYAPAKICGDLYSPVLVFGEGVVFKGTSHMTRVSEEGEKPKSQAPNNK